MATRVFIVVSSGDKEVVLQTGLEYPLRATQNKWVDEVKVIMFGPSERLMAYDLEVQRRIKELQDVGVEIMACKPPADKMNVTEIIEGLGVRIEYVGPIITQMIKDGWASMTF